MFLIRTYRELLRYLFPPHRFSLNHGRRIISPYDLKNASEDERLLMLAGVARSPQDARHLMKKHHATSATDVLRVVERQRRYATARERLKLLIRRIDGHDTRDVWGSPNDTSAKVDVQYRYRVDE